MQDGYLVGKYLSENLNPSDAFRQLFEFRHESTDAVIKGSQWSGQSGVAVLPVTPFLNTSIFVKYIKARLRSGDQWYAWLFRKMIRAVIRINPNIILNQMVPRMTPNFADEKFMKELR